MFLFSSSPSSPGGFFFFSLRSTLVAATQRNSWDYRLHQAFLAQAPDKSQPGSSLTHKTGLGDNNTSDVVHLTSLRCCCGGYYSPRTRPRTHKGDVLMSE